MPQETEKILPLFLQLDTEISRIQSNESPFLKSVGFDQNGNPTEEAGQQGGTGEGANALVLTPVRSNKLLDNIPTNLLPSGYNKEIGSFESTTTQELYCFVYNGNLNHTIYVIDGNSGVCSKVIADPQLLFTDDQDAFITDHRVMLRTVLDKDGNIVEKFLLLTDGNSWHKWINVIAAIATNGFDASLFPYWTLQPPHFDRRELLEWAVRPIMQNPVAVAIPNTDADLNKVNNVLDQAFEFAAVVNLTDGRYSVLSPYSLPVIIKTEDFLNNPDSISKNILVTLYAGSCMVESIDLYVRQTSKQVAGIASTISWGTWQKYIRLYKYTGCGVNSPSVVGTNYWLRTNAWANYNYDPIQNTIQYTFDNSILAEIPSIDASALQNYMPQLSKALTPLGDAAAVCDNRYDYDNLPCETLNNLDVVVAEKKSATCPIPSRKVRLYEVIARASQSFTYESQMGYIWGATDTTTHFGSVSMGRQTTVNVDVNQSKYFNLDFADRKGPICYFKGTPFYSVGVLYQVNSDNSLTIAPSTLDLSDIDVQVYVENVFIAGGYFVYVFDFEVPAGKYDAALGRHNVSTSSNYRGTSTYVMGIANSRVKSQTLNTGDRFLTSIKPNALVTFSKELEIDCTNADLDVWGNGKDLFYVFCPSIIVQGNNSYRFVEGYLQESSDNPLGVELFPYNLFHLGRSVTDDGGKFTDKNGFYFASTKIDQSQNANIQVTCKLNCVYPNNFTIPATAGGNGYIVNAPAYLTDHNNGVVGDCNRILYIGKITNLDGTIPYSNIAISIVDGATVYTRTDGTFTLIIHNGQSTLRQSNIYVNASGNYLITILNCGQLPLFYFDETLTPCANCLVRQYPFQLVLGIVVQGGTQFSLKENSTYSIGGVIADLAGRLGYVNPIKSVTVPSFLTRDDVLATYFQLLIKGALNLPDDAAWFAPYVSNALNILRYIQWVGDSIKYIDNAGNVVTDSSTAVFVSIAIDSLYNYNVSKNFTLLSTYQFVPGDRLRILDDGNGNLLDTATFGSAIDLQILGTNYNQAAMVADLIPNTNTQPTVNVNNNISNSTTVNAATGTTTNVTAETIQNNNSITLFVRYDQRLDKLINDTEFWIELYTPSQQDQELIYNELTWYPIIKGEVAVFTGYANGKPTYNFPTELDITFWDTYLFTRNITIPNVGDKFLNHPFESANISDNFGYKVSSGGRQWIKNDNAKQLWYGADVNKSENLVTAGIINGLGIFKAGNRKDFSQYPWGGIVCVRAERGFVFFLCENDYFSTDYNFHYSYANAQGVMVTNLDEGLSTPHQKLGEHYGCAFEDTGSITIWDNFISWYDSKNMAWIISDYRSAMDITFFDPGKGVSGGLDAYINSKTRFISSWNKTHDKESRFDVVGGVDLERENIYLTFRPRRKNSNNPLSYTNNRLAVDLSHQETIVYSTVTKRFTRFESFAPEGYGKLRGAAMGTQLITFAAGLPYTHNTGNESYLNYYGVQCNAVVQAVFNKNHDLNSIFANIALNLTGAGMMFIDYLRTNQSNSFSFVPQNLFTKKESIFYAALMRDMNSYFEPIPENKFRSTLLDGKRIFNQYLLLRLVSNSDDSFFELKTIYNLITDSTNNKK